jgi:hypothetical protein
MVTVQRIEILVEAVPEDELDQIVACPDGANAALKATEREIHGPAATWLPAPARPLVKCSARSRHEQNRVPEEWAGSLARVSFLRVDAEYPTNR